MLTVKDLLNQKPSVIVTISPDKTLHEASKLLAEHNIGAVMVVDKNGAPQGILSERDIVRRLAKHGQDCLAMRVEEAMTKDLIIALPEDEVAKLSNVMTNNRIRHLPIMDGEQLVGIISIGDVVKAQIQHLEVETRTLRQYITGGYA